MYCTFKTTDKEHGLSNRKPRTIQPQKMGRNPRIHRDRLDCIRAKARKLSNARLQKHVERAPDQKVLRIYLEEMVRRSLVLKIVQRQGTFSIFLVAADNWVSVRARRKS